MEEIVTDTVAEIRRANPMYVGNVFDHAEKFASGLCSDKSNFSICRDISKTY